MRLAQSGRVEFASGAAHILGETDSETKGLIMDSFAYSRCVQCDEDSFFTDGSKCARCLGLSYVPIDDEDDEEESLSISLDRLAAA